MNASSELVAVVVETWEINDSTSETLGIVSKLNKELIPIFGIESQQNLKFYVVACNCVNRRAFWY